VSVGAAFVMAAGLGERLRPLTDTLPKPLVPVFGKPLVTFAFDHLIGAGITEIFVNTHHLAECFDAALPSGMYRGHPVRLIHEPVRLETGGGIKNAESAIGRRPFLVYSGDLLADLDLRALVAEHVRQRNHVTLALRRTGFAPSIACSGGRVTAIGRDPHLRPTHDFANVSVWDPSAFDRLPVGQPVSFVPVLREWIACGGRIGGVVLDGGGWFNVGTPEEYRAVHRMIAETGWRPGYVAEPGWPCVVSSSAEIPDSAALEGFNVIGDGCRVGEETLLRDCILWPGAKTASRIRLERCIVRSMAAQSATDSIL
jgi:mannose-1-phosphate guanylyltransferase